MPRAWQGIVGERFSPAEFVAYVADLKFRDFRPVGVVVHNTQIPTLAKWKTVGGAKYMRSLAGYYRDVQKWSAGPHLFVDHEGIWVFTSLTVPGVHSPSWNATHWGLEIVGDYATEEFTDEVKHNVISALSVLHHRMVWTAPRIRFHREDPRTTHSGCPGPNVIKAELEMKVEFMLVTGSQII